VRSITSPLIQKAGFTRKAAQTGAVTLIQQFGSALNLNVHFHMLFLDRQSRRPLKILIWVLTAFPVNNISGLKNHHAESDMEVKQASLYL
jgi:hypothetical protein